MKSLRSLSPALIFLALGACSTPATETAAPAEAPVDAAALKDAIQAREKEWSAAYLTGNGETVAALYAEDGASIPPTGDWSKGRPAIAKDLQNQLDSVSFTVREDITDEVIPLGADHALEIGHYQSSGTYKIGGKARSTSGRYMVLWRKDSDGVWRLLRDLGSDAPTKTM